MKKLFVILFITTAFLSSKSQNTSGWTSFDSTYQACLMARQSMLGEYASKEELKKATRLYAKSFQNLNIAIPGAGSKNRADISGHIQYFPSFFDSFVNFVFHTSIIVANFGKLVNKEFFP